MRLLNLHLHSSFRGLPAGFRIDFRSGSVPVYDQVEPICFVGLNGSGKSNVLQVLAEIFAYLEMEQLKPTPILYPEQSDAATHKLDFTLDYTLDEFNWNLARSTNSTLPDYSIQTDSVPIIRIQKLALESFKWGILVGGTFLTPLTREGFPPLPRHIVGYSSGMNELLSNPFIRLELRYLDRLLNKEEPFTGDDAEWQSQGYPEDEFDEYAESADDSPVTYPWMFKSFEASVNRNRMLYLDYESNKLITLANFLIPDAKRLSLLYSMAGIGNVRSFSITINYPSNPQNDYPSDSSPQEYNGYAAISLPSAQALTIDRLVCCASTWEGDLPEADNPQRLELHFWVNEATKEAFNHHFRTADNLLNELYALRIINAFSYSNTLREQLTKASFGENLSALLPRPEPKEAPFYVSDLILIKSHSNDEIPYRSLSDGEHQLLHVFGAIMLMEQPGTLFLLDEPETHFNPEWRSRFVSLLNQIVEDPEPDGIRKKRQQEVLLTSHSPFIVSDCKPENVFVFSRDVTGSARYKRAADTDFTKTGALNTLGASERVILQEVFGYRKSISEMVSQQIQRIKQEATSLEKVQECRQQLMDFGESFEKFDALNYLDIKEDEFTAR